MWLPHWGRPQGGLFFGAARGRFDAGFLRLNFFYAIGPAPSGGHILSSPAKKEYGKKDAAQGGGSRPKDPPLGWVSVAWVVMFRLPGRLVSASVPCHPVSKPLAASLALTRVRGWFGGWRGRWLLR